MVDNLVDYFEALDSSMDSKKVVNRKSNSKSISEKNSSRVKQFVSELTDIKRPSNKNKISSSNGEAGKSKTLPRPHRITASVSNKGYVNLFRRNSAVSTKEKKTIVDHAIKENNVESNNRLKINSETSQILGIDKRVEDFGKKLKQKRSQAKSQFIETTTSEVQLEEKIKGRMSTSDSDLILLYTNDEENYTRNNGQVLTLQSKEQYRCLDEDEQKEKKEKENEEESTDDMFGSNDFDEDHDDNYILEAYNKEGSELIITTLQITRRSMRQDEAEDIEKLISTSHFVFEEVEYENFNQNDTSSPESEVFYENVRKTSDKSISSKQTNVLDSNITENLSDLYDSDIYEEVHYDECDSSCNKQIKQRIQYRNLSTFGLRSSSEKREHGDNYYYSLNHFSDSDDALAQQEENTEQTSEPTSPTEASGKKEKINYVIEEMTKTEELYIAGLKIVVENYMPYLAKHTPQDLLGKDTYIFGNILLIYKKAQEFFALLQKDGETADSIADLFIASATTFDLYPLYSKNKPTADVYLKQFDEIVKERQEQLSDKLGLASYLLTPIQRLGKYILILEKIKKELIKAKKPIEKVCAAIEVVRKVMRKGNDFIAMDSIKNSDIDLLMQGSFIMRAVFNVLKPRKFVSMVFLFENAIIFTEKISKNLEQFTYLDSIYMSDLSLGNFEGKPNIFHLTHYTRSKRGTHDATYVLEAETPKLKNEWTTTIERILWAQLKEAKELQKTQTYNSKRYFARASLPGSSRSSSRRYSASSKPKSRFYDIAP
jgi:hypothetical protein